MSTKTQLEPPDTPGNVSAWTRMLWDAEAKYTATVGSRLKFGLPLSPAKPKRARAKVGKRAAVKGEAGVGISGSRSSSAHSPRAPRGR